MEKPSELEKVFGSYENPILIKNRMTTIKKVKDFVFKKDPEARMNILERQEIVEVKYLSHDKKVYLGQLVVDKDLVEDVKKLFEFIEKMNREAKTEEEKFFIEKIIPIQNKQYEGDDDKSMADNNTSAFNYRIIERVVEDKKILSWHAFGRAIDLNPKENPVIRAGEENQPKGAVYNETNPNTLNARNKIVRFLKDELGFSWGGDWNDFKDWHHFQKEISTVELASLGLSRDII